MERKKIQEQCNAWKENTKKVFLRFPFFEFSFPCVFLFYVLPSLHFFLAFPFLELSVPCVFFLELSFPFFLSLPFISLPFLSLHFHSWDPSQQKYSRSRFYELARSKKVHRWQSSSELELRFCDLLLKIVKELHKNEHEAEKKHYML